MGAHDVPSERSGADQILRAKKIHLDSPTRVKPGLARERAHLQNRSGKTPAEPQNFAARFLELPWRKFIRLPGRIQKPASRRFRERSQFEPMLGIPEDAPGFSNFFRTGASGGQIHGSAAHS